MFFGRSDHCHQWFYDGFLILLPSLSMVFDGSGPLVKRCNGFDGSLWSNALHSTLVDWVAHCCTKVIGSVPESDQKAHKYTCFVRSAWCHGDIEIICSVTVSVTRLNKNDESVAVV